MIYVQMNQYHPRGIYFIYITCLQQAEFVVFLSCTKCFWVLISGLQIPVRPYRHNEYERFIPAAYPYYGAAFSTMAGFFIFTVVHLYNK
uniref:Dolichyl-diphosphooligosaccharideprotein glycosyltransferase 48 kDa subunit n=1 Tax=Rhizophora mucronata TaxID=61149 RepID=A0A2P2K1M0_RHIMU